MRKAGYDKKFFIRHLQRLWRDWHAYPPQRIDSLFTEFLPGSPLESCSSVASLLAWLCLILFCAGIYYLVTKNKSIAPRDYHKVTWKQRIYSLKDLWGVLLVIVIVFGGIFFGIFFSLRSRGDIVPGPLGYFSCFRQK